jgi:hypothetical protein
METEIENAAAPSGSSRTAVVARWYAKLKSDPERLAKRLEDQRQRRKSRERQEKERQQAREIWAKLPKDHPRKTRKVKRNPETEKAKRKRDLVKLTASVVANRYLHMKVDECPEQLIELKREHIRLNRKLGTRIKSR